MWFLTRFAIFGRKQNWIKVKKLNLHLSCIKEKIKKESKNWINIFNL